MKQSKRSFSIKKLLPALVFAIPQISAWKRQRTYAKKREKALRSLQSVSVFREEKTRDGLDITLRSPIDGFLLSATLYPHANPIGIVQIIHGIHEHKGRYEPFARFLQSHGYAVLVSDTRGHGHSVDSVFPRGNMGSFAALRDDQFVISKYLKERFPDTPLYLFAHSLGTLIARAYLQEYDAHIDKLILCGTVMHYRLVGLGLALVRMVDFYIGCSRWKNLRFMRRKTEEEIRKIIDEDPDYLHGFHPCEVITVLELIQAVETLGAYKKHHLHLPILSISGEYDYLVTGGKSGINRTMKALSQLGYRDMISIVYPHMMHEILKDPKKEFIYQDILSFLKMKKTPPSL